MSPDRDQLYDKYLVFRHPQLPIGEDAFAVLYPDNGTDEGVELAMPGGPFFVLKPGGDQYARVAIAAYAESCRREYPQLAEDLDMLLELCREREDETV